MTHFTGISSLVFLTVCAGCSASHSVGSESVQQHDVGSSSQPLFVGTQQWAKEGNFTNIYNPSASVREGTIAACGYWTGTMQSCAVHDHVPPRPPIPATPRWPATP